MNRIHKLSLVILSASLFIGSCAKNDTSPASTFSKTVSNDATTPDLSKCKVRRIYQQTGPWSVETALFTYNGAGNPYSVLYSASGTSHANHFFFYDSKNRLKEYQLRWGDTYIHEFHFYRYNDKNQIIIDSTIRSDANDAYPYVDVSTIEYDNLGRVVKETIVNLKNGNEPLKATRRPTYTYDSRGNLAVAFWKSSSYDYKINPLRQNVIFQFIFRNYSMNNAAVQPKYNSLGLPLSMKPNNDQFFNAVETLKVIYDCQ
jgi:hypothetical protein